MSDIRELYQQMIIDHGRHPRNFGHVEKPTHTKLGQNPLCGDELLLTVKIKGDIITAIKFQGKGCAISMASASLMTEALQGKTIAEAGKIFGAFHQMLTNETNDDSQVERLGKLGVLSGVRAFPVRVKCATLAWHTLDAALKDDDQPVSTE